jgi:DNA-binding transcriptional LysR family regulator
VGRNVRPTEAGLAVLSHARELIEATRDLKTIAAQNLPAGLLSLGATATSLTGQLPQIISVLGSRFPKIDYFIQPGSSVDLYHQVAGGELDAAMIVQPQFSIPKSLGWLTLRREPLVLIAHEALPLEHPHTIIAREPYIRYDRNQWGGQLVDNYLRRNGLPVREWLELDALDAIAAMVDRELGVAIVPDWAPPWPEGLKLRKIALPDGDVRQTGVIWNRSGIRIAAVRAFVNVCEELAAAP